MLMVVFMASIAKRTMVVIFLILYCIKLLPKSTLTENRSRQWHMRIEHQSAVKRYYNSQRRIM